MIEWDLVGESVCADFIIFHKSFTDEEGSGPTVLHSRYRGATITAFEKKLDFEMRTQWRQLQNNARVNIVIKIRIHSKIQTIY